MALDPNRPKVPDVAPLVAAYYRKPENGAGGHCHVVLDDGNTDNGCIDFCLAECERAGDDDGARIMRLMRQMSQTQRRKVCRG